MEVLEGILILVWAAVFLYLAAIAVAPTSLQGRLATLEIQTSGKDKTTPAPKHRWFAFSLRAMFVVVTVLCIWLGWNLHQVQEREMLLKAMPARGVRLQQFDGIVVSGPLPLAWRVLGAQPLDFNWIILPKGEFTDDEVARIRIHFPDAAVSRTFFTTQDLLPPALAIPDKLVPATPATH